MNSRALLAWNVKRLRVERGLSQERLAADSGIGRTTIGDLERELAAASVDLLDRLAAVLSVEPAELLRAPASTELPPHNLAKGRKRH